MVTFNMKKLLICALALSLQILAIPAMASEDSIQAARTFYQAFEDSVNQSDYDTTLKLIKETMTEDFGHYDDGVFSYGKDELISKVQGYKDNDYLMGLDIDMKEMSFNAEKNEVNANFIINQKYFTLYEENGKAQKKLEATLTLECNDSLRVEPETDPKLYKCYCKTLSRTPPL